MHPRTPRTAAAAIAVAIAALALPTVAGAATAAAKAKPKFYVSLGDSYSVGWQRHSADPADASPTTKGYANDVVGLAKAKGHRFKLVNFGCAGATTTSILKTKGCAKPARALHGPKYTTTQASAATKFIKAHQGQIGLITVAIGGNDVTACAKATDAFACVSAVQKSIKKHVTSLAKALRKAAGKKVEIVGLTYPDVILGQWVLPPVNQDLAKASVPAFQQLINPTLKTAYAASKGKFADVTAATGAYTPLDQTTTLDPYGTIPVAVATVCQLTFYCQFGDIHANDAGYLEIAKLVTGLLPKH
jgi:lysophospholipase L1-like esterase